MEANPSKKPITLPAAVTLLNNRKSISAQQKIGAEANRNRKRKRTEDEEAEALAAQKAGAIALQDELDEQFARDVEAAVARRERARQERGRGKAQDTPTPAVRSKRTIKKSVQWEPDL